jgi:hypothetical protein
MRSSELVQPSPGTGHSRVKQGKGGRLCRVTRGRWHPLWRDCLPPPSMASLTDESPCVKRGTEVMRMTAEWVEYDASFVHFNGDERGLVGLEVELQDGSCYVIGDVNLHGGGCDCCSVISWVDTIKRYRRVWQRDDTREGI